MRNTYFILLLGTTLIIARPANSFGQDHAAAAEIFVGGSRLYESPSSSQWGFTLGASGNVNRFFGVETNLSFTTSSVPNPPAHGDYFRFLAGPRFEANGDAHLSPFAHFLVGTTRGSQDCYGSPQLPGCNYGDWTTYNSAFTTDIGAGVDVKVFRSFWIRAVQAGYLHVYYPGAGQNRYQLSFGAVFRIGSRGKRRRQ
jgi:hypothetical protein